jgi:hypothetical protein
MMRALLEQHAGIESDPGKLLTQINRELFSILKHTGTSLYATAVMMVADAAQQELRYANAGHPKPLHVRRRQGDTVPLNSAGQIAGAWDLRGRRLPYDADGDSNRRRHHAFHRWTIRGGRIPRVAFTATKICSQRYVATAPCQHLS